MGSSALLCLLLATGAQAFTPSARWAAAVPIKAATIDEDQAPAPSPVAAVVAEGDVMMNGVIGELNWYDNTKRTVDPATMPGVLAPVGFWDPAGFTKSISDNQLRWYRAAELKHGRVCMLAFSGWLVSSVNGVTWAGTLGTNGPSFKSIGELKFYEQWDALPPLASLQILSAIGMLEFVSEAACKPHYIYGGSSMGPNFYPFNSWYARFEDRPEKLRVQQNKELNNGRLAMLGVASLYSAHAFPGSVPFLPNPY